jgi:3-phosphoshikimate 1-carboxyvinyltransferase
VSTASSDRASRTVVPAKQPLSGTLRVPGDKSIAHRAVMLNAAARGTALVRGVPSGGDVASTIGAMRALGCTVERDGDGLRITGRALGFAAPARPLDCENSGTTIRLLTGLLAGTGIEAVLDGDASLKRRPMERVATPLRALGARVETTGGRAPVRVHPAKLMGAHVDLDVASAQVKSAVLFAGLSAHGRTEVREPAPSRDHSERMLAAMGVPIVHGAGGIALDGPVVPRAVDVEICGDASSAAFFAVAAALVEGSDVTIENVCLNPTRTGFVAVLRRMGADDAVEQTCVTAGESGGSLRVRGSELRAVDIGADEVPSTIDELPVLAVAAAFAEGTSTISGASELRVKESDRIATVSAMLMALGAHVEAKPDGLVIDGAALRGGARVATGGDHRLVMSAAVAALACRAPVEIEDPGAAAVSFPGFFAALEGICGG